MIIPDTSVTGAGQAARAANEYIKFANESLAASGVEVGWLRESAFNFDKKYISLGLTDKYKSANLGITDKQIAALGDSGYIIKSDISGNIYVVVGDEDNGWMGYLAAVYDLLNEFFGYEYYADGVYSLNKSVTAAKFITGDLDKIVIPSFAYRQRSLGFDTAASTDKEFNGYRLLLNRPTVYGFNGGDMHDIMAAIPYSEYGEAHPDWYQDNYKVDGGQPCFTRYPDGIAKVIVDKMIPIVAAAEEKNSSLKNLTKYFYVGMYDSQNWCACSSCAAYINAHGGYKSSTYIYFMNKVAALLRAANRTDISPVMLAYHATQDAPVKVNSDGTITLISDDMKLDEIVTVYYCPIEANYYVPFDYDGNAARENAPSVKERNSLALKNLKGWGVVSQKVMYYFYMEHFPFHYMEFFDIFGSMQTNYRYAAQNGGIAMYNLSQYNEPVATGFARLKEYVSAKLMYNVNADVDELIGNFFANYFGAASEQMLAIFNEQRAMFAEKFASHPEYGDMSQYAVREMSADLFDKTKVIKWIKDFDSAYAAVNAAYEADAITEAEKNRLYKAIKLESMSIRAVYIQYFTDGKTGILINKSDDTTSKDFGYTSGEMVDEWKADAKQLGMTLWGEHETLEKHYSDYAQWKVKS